MAERPNNTGVNKTRALQHTLYWAAKRSPKRRFHALLTGSTADVNGS
jgi:hypothetical protein